METKRHIVKIRMRQMKSLGLIIMKKVTEFFHDKTYLEQETTESCFEGCEILLQEQTSEDNLTKS